MTSQAIRQGAERLQAIFSDFICFKCYDAAAASPVLYVMYCKLLTNVMGQAYLGQKNSKCQVSTKVLGHFYTYL